MNINKHKQPPRGVPTITYNPTERTKQNKTKQNKKKREKGGKDIHNQNSLTLTLAHHK
jgi:hypothetical protein